MAKKGAIAITGEGHHGQKKTFAIIFVLSTMSTRVYGIKQVRKEGGRKEGRKEGRGHTTSSQLGLVVSIPPPPPAPTIPIQQRGHTEYRIGYGRE